MVIRITCKHVLGFKYVLVTNLNSWTEEQAVEQAKKTATDHFGLLPAPTNYTIEVLREED